MNMRSNEAACHASSSSLRRIANSCRSRSLVRSVDILRISFTDMKWGFSSEITHAFGERDTSHAVKAYRASIVLSGDASGSKWTIISTCAAVLSSTRLILIFPASLASRIDSIIFPVVFVNGISVIVRVLRSVLAILARIFTFPPRCPSA